MGAGQASKPHRIDVHHHITPPPWLEVVRKAKLDNPPLANWSVAKSIDDMDKAGIATSMTSPTTPLNAMNVPNLVFWYLSMAQPESLGLVTAALSAEMFGYGFGFAGYMIYLMRIAQRSEYRTAHYAIATGLGAMCIMVAGISSGVIQKNFGYTGLFAVASFAAIPGLLTLLIIPMDEEAAPAAA